MLRACTLHQIDRKQVLSQAKNVFRGLGATTSSLVGFRAARPLVHFRGARRIAHRVAFRFEKSTARAFTHGTQREMDVMVELDERRREAHNTASRMGDLARARRAAVTAARLTGGTRAVHVRRVTLLLVGETALRRARVRAAAAAAAANSGPIDTTGLL